MWSELSLLKLKNLKQMILKKKVMLGFIIDNYAWWDRVYRWTHMGLAICAPLIVFIQTTVESSNSPSTAGTVLGCIVAGMIKAKEYLTYDKLRDLAKEQTIKYGQLYESIELEIMKSPSQQQPEKDFLYWVTREYGYIDISDPELSHGEKKKFLQLCKDRNIPYNDDLHALEKLINTPIITSSTPIVTSNTPIITSSTSVNLTQPNAQHIIDVLPSSLIDVKNNIEDEKTNNVDSIDNVGELPTMHRVLSLYTDPVTLNEQLHNNIDHDIVSRKNAKEQYKKTLKNINVKADLQWTIDRLSNINE